MAIQSKKTTKNEVSTTIDIKQLLGPLANDRDVRESFFQIAFDRMEARLDDNRDVNGKLFVGYSEEYINSLAFNAFGKSKKDVNMKLTGDMRASVEILDQNSSKMKIGVAEDQAPKAFNHMTGDTVPRREWFGWKDDELKTIANEFKPLKDERPTLSDVQIVSLIDRILGNG